MKKKMTAILLLLVGTSVMIWAQDHLGLSSITWKEKYSGARYQPYFRSIFPLKKGEKNYKVENDYVYSGFSIHANLTYAMPLGQLKNDGFGFNVGATWQPASKMPLSIGIESGMYLFAGSTKKADIEIPITSGGAVIDKFTIPIEYRVRTHIYPVYPVIRVWTPTPYVQLYGEAIFGMHIFSTDSKLVDMSNNHVLSSEDDNVIVRKNNSLTATYAFGGGLGLSFSLYGALNIFTSVRYLAGGLTSYYDQNAIKHWDVEYIGTNYDPSTVGSDDVRINAAPRTTSYTTTLQYMLGLQVRIP